MATVALVTCSAYPNGDADDARLPAEFRDAKWVVWDDAGVDWAVFDRVVLRSTWDYAPRRDAFVAWAERVGAPRLVNPPDIVRWNTDKRYLAELPRTVATTFFPPGEAPAFPGGEFIVKPTVSAGARDTARFGPGEHGRAGALVTTIHAGGRTAMVQPYVPSVDARGETALLFFAGTFSHAVRKGPILRRGADPIEDLFAAEEISATQATAAELVLAGETLAVVRERFGSAPPYARVDVVQGTDGHPLVLELELVEPSLFFSHAPGAIARFADAVLGR